MDTKTLVRAAIAISGLSTDGFAFEIMAGRSGETVRRWMRGDSPISASARRWLEQYVQDNKDGAAD